MAGSRVRDGCKGSGGKSSRSKGSRGKDRSGLVSEKLKDTVDRAGGGVLVATVACTNAPTQLPRAERRHDRVQGLLALHPIHTKVEHVCVCVLCVCCLCLCVGD